MVDYRWKIFWAKLDPVIGSEQAEKRPVLVVSAEEVNQNLSIVTILPLTSARPGRRVYPTEMFLGRDATGLSKDSVAMAHQIRTIAKDRLESECGRIEGPELRDRIKKAIERHLGFI